MKLSEAPLQAPKHDAKRGGPPLRSTASKRQKSRKLFDVDLSYHEPFLCPGPMPLPSNGTATSPYPAGRGFVDVKAMDSQHQKSGLDIVVWGVSSGAALPIRPKPSDKRLQAIKRLKHDVALLWAIATKIFWAPPVAHLEMIAIFLCAKGRLSTLEKMLAGPHPQHTRPKPVPG